MAYRPLDLKISMENKELDPKRFFVFLNPIDTQFHEVNNIPIDKFETSYKELYTGVASLERNFSDVDFDIISFTNDYYLPHKFDTKPLYDHETGEVIAYEHTMIQMSDSEVDMVFLNRLVDYRDDFNKYLDFHYKSYHGLLSEFLDRIVYIINAIDTIYILPLHFSPYNILQLKRKLLVWVKEKRSELNELGSLEIVPQDEPQAAEEMSGIKLRFRNAKGDKKALYYVLHQLSEREILPKKDWKHIANFLVQNVAGFESNNPDDIAGEISRIGYEPPKDKNKIDLSD